MLHATLNILSGTDIVLADVFRWYVVPGWSSLTVLVSLIGGAMLMSIGVLGEYVGKIYEQQEPPFVSGRRHAQHREPGIRAE